jgi:hypothetical protein
MSATTLSFKQELEIFRRNVDQQRATAPQLDGLLALVLLGTGQATTAALPHPPVRTQQAADPPACCLPGAAATGLDAARPADQQSVSIVPRLFLGGVSNLVRKGL